MSGSPWFGVLMIAGAFGGGLLLILLIAKAEGLRNAVNHRLGLPLLIALATAGVIVSGLTLRFGLMTGIWLPVFLGMTLLNLSDAPRAWWARCLLWLDGSVLLAAASWTFAFRDELFVGEPWRPILVLLMAAGVLWAVATSFRGLIRPSTAPSNDQTLSETGTPA